MNGLVKFGAGTMIMTSPAGYSGATTISAGTLQLGNGGYSNDGTLGSSSVINNGSLVFDFFSNQAIGAAISGSGAVVQNGNAVTTLTGSNSYGGGTVINGGVLSIANDWNLGAAPAVANSASIALNGGTLRFTAVTANNTATINNNRGITLGASGGTLNVAVIATGVMPTSDSAVQYRGSISGPGNLTVIGGGGANSGSAPYLLELGATSSYTGSTTIDNATVCFNNNYAGSRSQQHPAHDDRPESDQQRLVQFQQQ